MCQLQAWVLVKAWEEDVSALTRIVPKAREGLSWDGRITGRSLELDCPAIYPANCPWQLYTVSL